MSSHHTVQISACCGQKWCTYKNKLHFFHINFFLFTSQFTHKWHCQWQFRFYWFLVSESYTSFVCTRATVTVSAEVLFLIAGGGGRVQLMCWAAQMRVNPPDRLYTLPPGPWLSQTLHGDRGQAWPSCALTLHGSPLTLWVGGPPCLSLTLPGPAPFFCASILVPLSPSLSHSCCLLTTLSLTVSHFLSVCYFFHLSLCLSYLFSFFATVIFGQQLS